MKRKPGRAPAGAIRDPSGARVARKMIAVGDLHGDYYRLLRVLRETGVFLEDRLEWNPAADKVDLVLLGDYVDWRGEPLEGPPEEWPHNVKRLLDLILTACREAERLQAASPTFTSRVHTLLGNHDHMMLESYRILTRFSPFVSNMILKRTNQIPFLVNLMSAVASREQVDDLFRIINWYEQGGEMTVTSYGGVKHWMETMEGELGRFVAERLKLGVIVGGRLCVHTVPDSPDHWIPLDRIERLPEVTREAVREGFMWGRRLWGVSVTTGTRIPPYTQGEMEEFLRRMGAERVLVGHTPFFRRGPMEAYQGKVVNLDTHGVPGSTPYVEEYEVNARID